MDYNKNKPLLYHKKQSEITLSPEALLAMAQAVLSKGLPFRFSVGGFSMLPFIKDGDVITLSPIENDGYLSTGDVVAAFLPIDRKVFIHRVVKRINTSYLIRGDNCPENDGIFPYENILGKVTRIERQGKKKMLGLGPERFIIAFLSRNKHLFAKLFIVRKLARFIKAIIKRKSL